MKMFVNVQHPGAHDLARRLPSRAHRLELPNDGTAVPRPATTVITGPGGRTLALSRAGGRRPQAASLSSRNLYVAMPPH